MSFSWLPFLQSFFCRHVWVRSSRLEQGQLVPTLRCMKCGRVKDDKPPRPGDRRNSYGGGDRRGQDSDDDCGDRF
jgi:hypothetical protein